MAANQNYCVETWCEKDALSGILEPIAQRLDIGYLANRGNSSDSAMYEAGKRLQASARQEGKLPVVVYLGDFDPSGEDMTRDITSRLDRYSQAGILVDRIALTFEQVQTFSLPPNPVKLTDSRAKAFIEKYGGDTWELDALEPSLLESLVSEAIEGYMDGDRYATRLALEGENRQRLADAIEQMLAQGELFA